MQVSVANSRTYSNGVPVLTERGLPVGPVRDLLEGSILRLSLFPSLSTLATVSVRLDFEGGTDAERRTPRPRTDPLHAIRRGRLGACLPFLPFLPSPPPLPRPTIGEHTPTHDERANTEQPLYNTTAPWLNWRGGLPMVPLPLGDRELQLLLSITSIR